MYRAVSSSSNYPPENVNTANLAGCLWYLQNEVVTQRPRKFGISRILRFKFQTKTTAALAAKGMNFGVRYAFDSGQCTGPFSCDEQWQKYGYFVGCNNLGSWPFPEYAVHYPGAIWYSLPKQGACLGAPTGACDCTFSYTSAGEINIDELEGPWGQSFWDNANDDGACAARLAAARTLFQLKYPDLPPDTALSAPTCDFNRDKFYS